MTAPAHQVAGLSFTPEELEARKSRLGASEVPAVVGINPYQTPFDIYCQKRGLVEPFAGNHFSEWGLRLEREIGNAYLEKIVEATMSIANKPAAIVHPEHAWASASPDLIVRTRYQGEWGVEVKNKNERQIHKWGEPGTDQVPGEIAVQCHWSMFVTGLERWDVAALFGGNEFRTYTLRKDEEIAAALFEQCREFWHEHVLAGEPPAIGAGDGAAEFLKSRFPRHGDLVRRADRATEEYAEELRVAREQKKHFETLTESLENKIKLAIGDAAGVEGRFGRALWKLTASGGVDYKAIAEELRAPPAMLEKYTRPGTRRFTFTPRKED